MYTLAPGHFLLDLISSDEDLELLLSKYNICVADDILRDSVKYDDRLVLISSSKTRETMCTKKLPLNFKKAGLTYDPSKIIFLPEDKMPDFIFKALEDLKSEGETKLEELPAPVEEPQVVEDVKQDTDPEPAVVEDEVVEVEPDNIPTIDLTKEQKSKDERILETELSESTVTINSGLCRYGVPKLEVSYITPNVIGLEESLFVNVEREDLDNFFDLVKNRVLSNLENDR